MGECWKLRTVIIKMKTLQKKIKEAFSSRKKPSIFLDPGKATSIDDDVKDVLWFCDKNVEFISLKDWNLHHGAFYAFNSEAFIYFLPNVLILSLGEDGDGLIPAGSFLDMLDRSPNPEYWDDFFVDRLCGLTKEEYSVIKEWLIEKSKNSLWNEVSLGRAFDTVSLLEGRANSCH